MVCINSYKFWKNELEVFSMKIIALSEDELRDFLIKACREGQTEPDIINGPETFADSVIRKLKFRDVEDEK